jgi:hypothetical protein
MQINHFPPTQLAKLQIPFEDLASPLNTGNGHNFSAGQLINNYQSARSLAK